MIPEPLSHNSVATALLRRSEDDVWIGLDDDDLPAAQGFVGNSELLVAPAWRLPREVKNFNRALSWVGQRLEHEYGLGCLNFWCLGGAYHPSLGITPEVVHPFAVEVEPRGDGKRPLCWVRVEEAVANRCSLQDGHLRIVLLRAAHALGMLSK